MDATRIYTKEEYVMNTARELLKKEIERVVEERMPGTKVCFATTKKNNGVELEGFHFMDGKSIKLIVYINSYVEDIVDGYTDVKTVAEKLVDSYVEADMEAHDTSFINKEFIKKNVVFRIVNKEMNDLTGKVYEDFLDLAKVMYVTVTSDENGNASFAMTDVLIKMFGLDKAELFELAEQNTKNMQYEFSDLSHVIYGGSGEGYDDTANMIVATTKNRTNGAIVITMTDEIAKVADTLGTDLYVLPSSIHEVLLVKAEFEDQSDAMNNMVMEVNRAEVYKQEWLADHAYFFCRQTRELRIA